MRSGQRLVALTLATLACVALAAGYRATLTPVTLIVDGERSTVHTHQPTVEMLLADLGYTLRPEDHLFPDPASPLSRDMAIRIDHAEPVVVVADGREQILYAHEEAPADLLAEADVDVGRLDSITLRPASVTDPAETRMRIVVKRAKEVMLEQGGVRTTLHSHAATVGEAILEAGIRLYQADHVSPDPASPLSHGMHINLERSIPVRVRVDGHELRTRTHRTRVGEVLADLGVTINGMDYTSPPLDASLVEDMEIQVYRVTESVIVEQSPVPFESVWQPDPDSEIDTQRLLQEGEPGVLERRIRLRYENGQVVDRRIEGESIILAPQNRVMGYGTKVIVRTLDTPSGPVEYWRVIRMLATSYSASTAGVSPTSSYYGRTATGLRMRDGIVAVDPRVISLGSQVYVSGYGVGLAADTGGAIKGRRIDLGYSDENLELWYRWVDVYLLTPVPDVINYRGP
ncbi:MAG: ubiquitin-like domain-containing protein [Anaerolineae bacterium]